MRWYRALFRPSGALEHYQRPLSARAGPGSDDLATLGETAQHTKRPFSNDCLECGVVNRRTLGPHDRSGNVGRYQWPSGLP